MEWELSVSSSYSYNGGSFRFNVKLAYNLAMSGVSGLNFVASVVPRYILVGVLDSFAQILRYLVDLIALLLCFLWFWFWFWVSKE